MVMDFIVKDLDSNYRLDAFRNKADKIEYSLAAGFFRKIIAEEPHFPGQAASPQRNIQSLW